MMTIDPARSSETFLHLMADPGLQNEIAQIRSRDTLRRLTIDDRSVKWTYVAERLVRNAWAALLGLTSISRPEQDPSPEVIAAALRLGQLWESLSRVPERTDRGGAKINAIAAYELAGYQANAMVLARELAALEQTSRAEPSLLSEMITSFFQRRFLRTRELSRRLNADPGFLDVTPEQLVERAAVALLANSMKSAVGYFLTGDQELYSECLDTMILSREGFQTIGDLDHFFLVDLLLHTLPSMKRRSTWQLLDPQAVSSPRWTRYLKVQARGVGKRGTQNTSLVELWPSQVSAIKAGLLSDRSSKVVRMPTSAGKTRLAELTMMHTLIRKPGVKCLYIAPFRSLALEVEQNLASTFFDTGFHLATVIGSHESDSLDEVSYAAADVIVTTPEKLDSVIRHSPEFVKNVELVILDEGHIVEDTRRGLKYELLVTRLKRLVPEVRFVFLSAVVSRSTLADFAQWLGSSDTDVIESDWRPAVQRTARFEWVGSSGTLRFAKDEDARSLESFVPRIVSSKLYEYVNASTRRTNRTTFPTQSNKAQTAAELAYSLSRTGSVLVFAAQRDWADSVGGALLRRLELARLIGEDVPAAFSTKGTRAHTIASDVLGPDHPITVKLANGIAVHHRGVPDSVRKAVERDFRERAYQVIVATSTLAQGVNLPVSTVVMHSASRYDPDQPEVRRQVNLKGREFWNIAGRAGRARDETQGLIIHICLSDADRRLFANYVESRRNPEDLESGFLQYLNQLTSERISHLGSAALLDAELLAILVEESVEEVTEEWIRHVFDDTLAAAILRRRGYDPKPWVDKLDGLVRAVLARVPSSRDRMTYARTGLSISSCETLNEHIIKNQDALRLLLYSDATSDWEMLVSIVLDGVSLAEELRPNAELPVAIVDVLGLWMAGGSHSDLQMLLPEGVDRPAIVNDFVEDVFAYRLPWGISSYVDLAVAALGLNTDRMPVRVRMLPSMVRYGVPFPEAVWAMSAGVPTRTLAVKIASAYRRRGASGSFPEFLSWMTSLNVYDVQRLLDVSGELLDDVMEAVNKAFPGSLVRGEVNLDNVLPLRVEVVPSDSVAQLDVSGTRIGSVLDIARDYLTVADRNGVVARFNGDELGLLDRDSAQFLAPELDTGVRLSAVVEAIESDASGWRVIAMVDRAEPD